MNSTNGVTCILIRTDALLSIRYRNKLNEDMEADLFLPDYPDLKGDCTESDYESMTMSFRGFTLSIFFRKVSAFYHVFFK